MRVVYLNPVGAVGGAERCLLSVMAAVRQEAPGVDLHLIAATDGPLLRQAEGLGARAWLLPMPDGMVSMGDSALAGNGRWRGAWALARQALRSAPAAARYVRRLRKAIEDLGPTLIHSNGLKTHVLARLAGPHLAPVVWHVHDFLGRRPVMARVLRWAARRAAGAVAVSQAVGRDAREVLRGLPVEVVPNAIDLDHFAPGPGDGRRLDELAGLSAAEPGTLRVGLVATFARWKGQDLFLEAAARALGERPGVKVRFYVVGGPIYRTPGSQFSESELRQRAADLAIAPHVGFLGFQPDTADVYRALDVVVHASTQPEPFGLTIAEAMACARPAIVAQAGGAAELFADGHDAVGVPPNDVEALASAVGRLLEGPELRQRLGENARRTAVARFDGRRLGPQVLSLYNRFARAPAAPGPGRRDCGRCELSCDPVSSLK